MSLCPAQWDALGSSTTASEGHAAYKNAAGHDGVGSRGVAVIMIYVL
jgi:hypothetical protein